MTNDKRFEITGIDALSRDMFDAFERAAVAEKPKRRKRPAPAKPGPKPDHGDGLFPPFLPAYLPWREWWKRVSCQKFTRKRWLRSRYTTFSGKRLTGP